MYFIKSPGNGLDAARMTGNDEALKRSNDETLDRLNV